MTTVMSSYHCKYGAARAIINKIECARARRMADEERCELDEILTRIKIINESYELNRSYISAFKPYGLQCVADLEELEDLLKNQVKRKKFERNISIFVVGCQNGLADNFSVLKQIDEFFVSALNQLDDETEDDADADDLDYDSTSLTMEEIFDNTKMLTNKLGEINHDIIQLLVQLEQKKTAKGRKKLEAAMQKAKDDIARLNEALLSLHHDGREKEERLEQLAAQVDIKNKELLKLRHCAISEVTTKNTAEVEQLKGVISNRDAQIVLLEADVQRLEKKLGKKSALLMESAELSLIPVDSSRTTKNSAQEQKGIAEQIPLSVSTENNLDSCVLDDMAYSGNNSPEEIKSQKPMQDSYEEKSISQESEALAVASVLQSTHLCSSEEMLNGSMEVSVAKDSKDEAAVPSNRTYFKESGKLAVGRTQVVQKQGRTSDSNVNSLVKTMPKTLRKISISKHDAAQNSSTSGVSSVAAVPAAEIGLTDALHSLVALPEEDNQISIELIDLRDEEFWGSISPEGMPSRFRQYRKMALNRITELEDQVKVTAQKTRDKVEELKLQLEDQKTKWDAERKTLVESLSQSNRYQAEVNQDIALALSHLEDLVNKLTTHLPNVTDRDEVWLSVDNEPQSPLLRAGSELDVDVNEATLEEEFDQLEKMTDDAKVQMSRESTRLSADEREDFQVRELTSYNQQKHDMDDEISYDAKQFAVRSMDKSTSPPNFLSGNADIENHREVVIVIRQRMEDRLAKAGQWVEMDDTSHTMFKEEFEADGSSSLVIDGHQKVFHAENTSPAKLNQDSTAGTQPPPLVVASTISPVLEEYLKSYDDIVTFRQNLSDTLPNYGLSSYERVVFDEDAPLKPQIIRLSRDINRILSEILDCFAHHQPKTKPDRPFISTEPFVMQTPDPEIPFPKPDMESTDQAAESENLLPSEDIVEADLRAEYKKVTDILHQEKRRSNEQFYQNSVLVSEMQDTIGNLKRELSNLRLKAAGIAQNSQQFPSLLPLNPSNPVIFTRLDSERNVKIMRKAIVEQRISVDQCRGALHRMKRYVEIPSQRLQHLVGKYICHQNLMEIRESLNLPQTSDDSLFKLLTKMETYYQKRLQKYAEKSQTLDNERIQLAKELMDVLSNIELESGIFLIKPIYSYKGSGVGGWSQIHQSKRTRTYQPRYSSKRINEPCLPLPSEPNLPSSQSKHYVSSQTLHTPKMEYGVQGTTKPLVGIEMMRPVWKPTDSTTEQMSDSLSQQPTVPHLLELDVNRVIIGNNNISMKLHQNSSASVLHPSSQLMSYVAANRPNGSTVQFRPASVAGLNSVPPSSPALLVHKTEKHRAKVFHSARTSPTSGVFSVIASSPLPPISSSTLDGKVAKGLPESVSISLPSVEEDEDERDETKLHVEH